jgi:predicted small lipoprotein YifL
MKKYFLGLILFFAVTVLTGCGLFKEKCNCPHFDVKAISGNAGIKQTSYNK